MMKYLDARAAARVYDRIGKLQDTQAFYESPAIADLVAHSRLDEAGQVLEVGCGTGAFAEELLAEHLPDDAHYTGIDVSTRMIELSTERTAKFGDRAKIIQTDGSQPWPVDKVDRVVAIYVLDILSPEDLDRFFTEAARVLTNDGLLAITSLAKAEGGVAGVVSSAWLGLWKLSPYATGGCRPLELGVPAGWTVVHDATVTSWGVASRSLVLRPSSA